MCIKPGCIAVSTRACSVVFDTPALKAVTIGVGVSCHNTFILVGMGKILRQVRMVLNSG